MTLEVRDLGAGPCVMILGGSPTPASHVMPLAERLATRHRVLVPDLPGYGASPALDPYSLEGTQRLLEDAVLARQIEDVALVGLSLGAYRALAIAIAGRVRVRRVACLGGFAGWDPPVPDALLGLAGLIRAGATHVGEASMSDVLVGQMLSPAFAAKHPAIRAEVATWLTLLPADQMAAELEASARCRDLRPELATLSMPILVRVGTLDAATPPVVGEAIARQAPHGAMQLVDGTGHLLLFEDPDATTAAVENFLA